MIVPIPCVCPGSPHAQDTVTLRDVLDFRTGKALRYRVQLLEEDERTDTGLVLAVLTEGYLLYGIEAWSLQDEAGKPVPVSRAAIETRLLPNALAAEVASDAADELYAEAVMRPLLRQGWRSSQPGPTTDSISPTTGPEPTPLRLSRQSSTSITRTDDTAATTA